MMKYNVYSYPSNILLFIEMNLGFNTTPGLKGIGLVL